MAGRPELVSTTVVEPLIVDRTFVIDDVSGETSMGTPVPRGRIAASGANGIVCITGGNDFYPTVRIEVWTGEPPLSTQEWDAVDTVELHSVSGVARTRDLGGTWWGDPIPLGPPITYRLRAHSRGRRQALEARELFFHGVEEWLLTAWPTPAQTHVKRHPRTHVSQSQGSPTSPGPAAQPAGREFFEARHGPIPGETPEQVRARAQLARQMARRSPSLPRDQRLHVDWHDIRAFATAIQEELTPPELAALLQLLTKPPTK